MSSCPRQTTQTSINHYLARHYSAQISLVGMSGRNVVGTHPYAHPQHIMVVKRDEYGLGVQPLALHFTITYRLGAAQISDKLPTAWSA